jgi:hypothetical protein
MAYQFAFMPGAETGPHIGSAPQRGNVAMALDFAVCGVDSTVSRLHHFAAGSRSSPHRIGTFFSLVRKKEERPEEPGARTISGA